MTIHQSSYQNFQKMQWSSNWRSEHLLLIRTMLLSVEMSIPFASVAKLLIVIKVQTRAYAVAFTVLKDIITAAGWQLLLRDSGHSLHLLGWIFTLFPVINFKWLQDHFPTCPFIHDYYLTLGRLQEIDIDLDYRDEWTFQKTDFKLFLTGLYFLFLYLQKTEFKEFFEFIKIFHL